MSTRKQQNPRLPAHLSEEAINDLLIDKGSAEAEQHLAACAHCRDRVAGFHSDLDLFNQATLAASQAKAAPIPAHTLTRRPQRLPARPLAWGAAASALLLAGAVLWSHQPGAPLAAPPARSAAAEFADSPDQIAQDNQLLRNVYNALEEEPQSPVNEFSIAADGGSSSAPAKARTP